MADACGARVVQLVPDVNADNVPSAYEVWRILKHCKQGKGLRIEVRSDGTRYISCRCDGPAQSSDLVTKWARTLQQARIEVRFIEDGEVTTVRWGKQRTKSKQPQNEHRHAAKQDVGKLMRAPSHRKNAPGRVRYVR